MDKEERLAYLALNGGWIELPEGGALPAPDAGSRYEVLQAIGAGGMGRIVRAHDRELGRDVAIKFVAARDASDTLADRMVREARILSPLEHPNIVRTYDIGRNDRGEVFFVMQLIEGRTLASVLKEAPPSLSRRLQMFVEVCRAVSYAHARGVVHRDLKPQNLLVGSQGEMYVADWGLATFRAAEASPKGETRVIGVATREGWGTPGYAAPEQRDGHAVDPLVDVYALGVVLREMVTLEPPTVFQPVEAPVGAPREIAAIIAKATAEEPGRRYPSVQALSADVQAYLDGRSGSAWRVGPLSRAARWVRRRPAHAAAMSFGVALVVLAVLWSRREKTFRLTREASDALARADAALRDWRARRYFPRHDVTPYRQELAAAATDLCRAIAIQPQAPELRARLGWALLKLGRTEEGVASLEQAVRAAPGEGGWHWWLAMACSDSAQRNPKEAKTWLGRAKTELHAALASPTWSAEPWEREFARISLDLDAGKREETLRRAEERAAAFPQGGEEILFALAFEFPSFSKRLSLLEQAARLAPSWARAHAFAALAAASVGSDLQQHGAASEKIEEAYKSALAHGEAAMEIDGTSYEALAGRAGAHLNYSAYLLRTGGPAAEHLKLAIADYDRALALEPDREELLADRGDAHANLGHSLQMDNEDPSEEYRLAVDDESRAIQLDPANGESWMSRAGVRLEWAVVTGKSHHDPGSLIRAAIDEDLTEAVRRMPGSPNVWVRVGYAHHIEALYLGSKKDPGTKAAFAAADDAFTHALELDGAWVEARWRRGMERLKSGRPREALMDLEEAIQQDPGLADMLDPLLQDARAAAR